MSEICRVEAIEPGDSWGDLYCQVRGCQQKTAILIMVGGVVDQASGRSLSTSLRLCRRHARDIQRGLQQNIPEGDLHALVDDVVREIRAEYGTEKSFKIAVVRAVRDRTHLGLADAKRAVDDWEAKTGQKA